MGVSTFYRHPRQSPVRKLLFQIHLWLGVGLGIYAALVGLTGSLLVFRPELQQVTLDDVPAGAERISPDSAAEVLRRAYPDRRLLTFIVPQSDRDVYAGWLFKGSNSLLVHMHPVTGALISSDASSMRFWNFVSDLHVNLLAGSTGHVASGVLGLLTICILVSGLVLWWQGAAHWKRGLKVQTGARWRRLNWDLHSAVGFWASAALLIIALTGVYFVWPAAFRTAVGAFGTLSQRGPYPIPSPTSSKTLASVEEIIAVARKVQTNGRPGRINLSESASKAVRVVLYEGGFSDHRKYGYLFLHPVTLEVLRADLRETRTAADSVIAWFPAIHFGTFAGVSSRVLWCFAGLVFPLLFVTGLIMWWSRRSRNAQRHRHSSLDALDFVRREAASGSQTRVGVAAGRK